MSTHCAKESARGKEWYMDFIVRHQKEEWLFLGGGGGGGGGLYKKKHVLYMYENLVPSKGSKVVVLIMGLLIAHSDTQASLIAFLYTRDSIRK